MRHWFKDRHFKALLKNSGYLAVSKAVAAVAALATLAFAGRSLGVLMFGMLILITSYVKAASGISKFQSWQLIVRYGGQALRAGETTEFKASTGFGLALDVVSGFGGMILAILLLPLLGGWFGIEERYFVAAMLYCTLLPTMSAAVRSARTMFTSASPSAIIRSLGWSFLSTSREVFGGIVTSCLQAVHA
jgi:O-antigen/teichoic acid export membrane protein